MPDVVFPVTCPKCHEECLSSLSAGTLERALRSGEVLVLRSACHKVEWPASPHEVQQIREYLWAAHLG